MRCGRGAGMESCLIVLGEEAGADAVEAAVGADVGLDVGDGVAACAPAGGREREGEPSTLGADMHAATAKDMCQGRDHYADRFTLRGRK